MGAVRLFDNSGNLLATTPIFGIGQGPAIAFGPGTQTTLGQRDWRAHRAWRWMQPAMFSFRIT